MATDDGDAERRSGREDHHNWCVLGMSTTTGFEATGCVVPFILKCCCCLQDSRAALGLRYGVDLPLELRGHYVADMGAQIGGA